MENYSGSYKDSTSIVLLRKIVTDVSSKDIQNAFSKIGEIKNVQIITKKHYAYVEFKDVETAIKCVEHFNNNSLYLGNTEVNVYMIGPETSNLKPLDLNPPSKIVLFTFFKRKVDVTTMVVRDLIESHAHVKKVKSFYF